MTPSFAVTPAGRVSDPFFTTTGSQFCAQAPEQFDFPGESSVKTYRVLWLLEFKILPNVLDAVEIVGAAGCANVGAIAPAVNSVNPAVMKPSFRTIGACTGTSNEVRGEIR